MALGKLEYFTNLIPPNPNHHLWVSVAVRYNLPNGDLASGSPHLEVSRPFATEENLSELRLGGTVDNGTKKKTLSQNPHYAICKC